MMVQTGTVLYSHNWDGDKGFASELSQRVLDGWEILSSGYAPDSGTGGRWWAIIQKVEGE